MYGDLLKYHLSVPLVIMLLLLMMQLEKLGFIVFIISLMYLIFSRNGKLWFKIETEKKLKCLRSDNGGEYCNKEFDRYCLEHGIHRERTVPRTPQENGNLGCVFVSKCVLKG